MKGKILWCQKTFTMSDSEQDSIFQSNSIENLWKFCFEKENFNTFILEIHFTHPKHYMVCFPNYS